MAGPGPYGYTDDNQDRYNAIMQGYQQQLGTVVGQGQQTMAGYGQMMSDYAGVGQAQSTAIDQQAARQQAQAQQSLVSRGLGGSTMLDASNRGIGYDQSLAHINLNDTLAMNRAGMQQQALNYQQASQGMYQNVLGNQSGFQAGAFQQKYGIEAGYGNTSQLQRQASDQNIQLAQLNTNNQAYLGQLQHQQVMQQQMQQNRFQEHMQNTFGYY